MVTVDPSALEELLVVQGHDLAIDRLVLLHANLPERQQLLDANDQAKQVLARTEPVEAERKELSRNQKRLEDEVAGLEAKTAQENDKLYGGAVTAMKELQALQDEIAGLGKRQGLVEDQILELMEKAEPLDEQLSVLATESSDAQQKIADITQQLAKREQEVDVELEQERQARQAAVEPISDELMAEYEQLRIGRQGVAIARLSNRACQGCFLELSAVEVDRMKREADNVLVYCDECGRILVR